MCIRDRLNDVMFMEAAQALAKKTAAQSGSTEEKLRALFLRIFCRPAETEEITTLAAFFNAQNQRFAKGELDSIRLGSGPVGTTRPAWTLTIRALLNTDEFVTKD